MSLYRLIPVSCLLTLTACNFGKTFENYQMPTGYTYLDTSPISTPHGYNKTLADEDAVRDNIATHADGWKNAVLNALTPISSVLDMSQPVAVVAAPPLTPLNSAAANYAREIMINMNYLVALPMDTTQMVRVDGKRIGKESDEMVQFKLSVERDGITYASRTIEVKMKPQESEESMLPLWTHLDPPLVPPPATIPEPSVSIIPLETTTSAPIQSTLPSDIMGVPVEPAPPLTSPVKRGLAVPLVGK